MIADFAGAPATPVKRTTHANTLEILGTIVLIIF
tara:strand:+ start:355 stop:456 length:102 start_codon:yes stop_codon:yes gene_type:complete